MGDDETREHTGGTQPTPEMVGGMAPQGAPPGSAGGVGPMETGPSAGSGDGDVDDLPEELLPGEASSEDGGPRGSQDSSGGDLDEAGG